MTPQLLEGKPVADAIRKRIKSEIPTLSGTPGLAVILVGEDPASQAYVGMKKKACAALGIESFEYLVDPDAGQAHLEQLIRTLNDQPNVNGILLQLPLPKGYDEDALLSLISPDKDVDGFHPVNVGKLLAGLPTFKSCTPYGVCEMMKFYNIDPAGKHVVILGRSNIVGKPLAAMLMQKGDGANATVTVCHSRTPDIAKFTRDADIVIAAIGKPGFVTGDMVRDGAVVIDVGINRVDDADSERGYKLVGDVAFDSVAGKASAITPVPGGVGPMTIAMLMSNTLDAFKRQQ